MSSRHIGSKWVVFLVIVALFLVACERPLPGGYNEAETGGDTTVPVEGSYPAPAADEAAPLPDAGPQDAEGYPAAVPELPADGAAYPVEESDAAPPPAEGELDTPAAEGDAAPPTADEAVEAYPADAAPAEPGAEAPADVPVETPAQTPGTHTVAAGENLYRISLLYGISWTELAAANGITNPANLSVGQVLNIPSAADVVETEEEAADVVDETGGDEPQEAAEEPAAETPDLPTTYIVQQGDNLFRIGLNFGIDWNSIVAANGIVNNFIYPGQELIIPAPDGTLPAESGEVEESTAPAETDGTEVPAEEAVPVQPVIQDGVTHVVEPGETVFGIAFRYGITWTDLVEANDIAAPYTLEPGQTLVIPQA